MFEESDPNWRGHPRESHHHVNAKEVLYDNWPFEGVWLFDSGFKDNGAKSKTVDPTECRVDGKCPDAKLTTAAVGGHKGIVFEIVAFSQGAAFAEKTRHYLKHGWAVCWLFCDVRAAQHKRKEARDALEDELVYPFAFGTISVGDARLEPGTIIRRQNHRRFQH